MFRKAILNVAAVCVLTSLYSLAQDASPAQTNSGTAPQASDAAQSQPADTQAKDAKAAETQTSTPAPAKSSSKKKKKKDKVINPIANLDSKQPDKALFDRAIDAMKHGKYDVARLTLQTLINTYPDSEYVARAKLGIADSWYAEGGTVALSQAENEYKDFITFFPNMPEAAEAQMKIANIHYKEMEKADRDPTHARRAEEEYRQLILNFPDSPLVPQAKEHLLEVQEVLARREYMIGHFYFLRDSYPAAIARLKSVTETYPLYSAADEALFELGTSYEREIELVRKTKMVEAAKGELITKFETLAVAAYSRILTQYPLESRAPDAKQRLEAMKKPVPTATPEAIAADKAQIESRGTLGTMDKIMENFHRGPDVSEATHVGEPTLVDPKQASAPDIVRAANTDILTALESGHHVSVEKTGTDTPPAENAPIPRSDATPGTEPSTGNAADSNAAQPAGSEMKNDLAPADNAPAAPPLPPTQVNDIAGTSSSSGSQESATASQTQATPANPETESSSKKKKKKHLLLF